LPVIVIVIVISKILSNCNLIVIEINVIDPCLVYIQAIYILCVNYCYMTNYRTIKMSGSGITTIIIINY